MKEPNRKYPFSIRWKHFALGYDTGYACIEFESNFKLY